MDVSKLRRDNAKIMAAVVETPDGRLIAKHALTIYIPRRFEGARLANIGEIISIAAIFAIVLEDGTYGSIKHLGMMKITPTSTTIIDIDGSDYFGFYFESGAVITESIELLKDDKLPYKTFDEILARGNVPWYLNDDDLSKLFINSKNQAGLTLTGTNAPFEVIVAAMTRGKKDIKKYHRELLREKGDEVKHPYQFIALGNVMYGTTNTVSKLMGSHFDDALTSALVNPAERVEGIETLLRS